MAGALGGTSMKSWSRSGLSAMPSDSSIRACAWRAIFLYSLSYGSSLPSPGAVDGIPFGTALAIGRLCKMGSSRAASAGVRDLPAGAVRMRAMGEMRPSRRGAFAAGLSALYVFMRTTRCSLDLPVNSDLTFFCAFFFSSCAAAMSLNSAYEVGTSGSDVCQGGSASSFGFPSMRRDGRVCDIFLVPCAFMSGEVSVSRRDRSFCADRAIAPVACFSCRGGGAQ
mmetsp:Transcript_19228/g.67892  ORF Transcript_19228/g.67892 Transcript_19228/m.67892 type:complete len:224 (+) Transcript_19228:717-1388(+)